MTADFGAFADGEDRGVRRRHAVIGDDAAIDLQSGVLCDRHVGPDADRHDDERGRNDFSVHEFDALDLAVSHNRLGVGLGHHLDAARLDRLLQKIAGGGIELALHQGRHDVQHGHIHAALLQPGRGFEAEQAAADDDGLGARLSCEQHGVDVVEVAVAQNAG